MFASKTNRTLLVLVWRSQTIGHWAFDPTQFDSILKRLKVQAVQSNEGIEKNTTKVEIETNVFVDAQGIAVKPTRSQGRYKKRERDESLYPHILQREGILIQNPSKRNVFCEDDQESLYKIVQVPGESLKLKQLKVLIDEDSPSAFSNCSSKGEVLAYLKRKLEGDRKIYVEGKRVKFALKRS
ncbi:PIN2/TERF1-interacting telomerase inhibitor 1-like [Quillaja saponaria]|uniref:PIN2/TERF1-interacting telomerase inhibitor 1-like n=1 Tax=Quillaja saponaria TaxID=32244 RepID=A0AAD7L687_QUISA|nr:PIN2/TERF1-interacting telomerase inhibitor 1-like [Quillaja saponaria]